MLRYPIAELPRAMGCQAGGPQGGLDSYFLRNL
jgi:hypothetical protein